ncbi:putative F-box protein [Phytophthora cinnamomi]|uniref:putative F-box protein n=1 Tax=Phytophthora cinnamomi TaxID=4785 RepID=UPI00355A240D|nr:putative F-box protein [Phytophthora cinnamomi]
MTRRAKERRMERVHAKLRQHEEKLLRDQRLSARPSWVQLLATIDGPPLSSNGSSSLLLSSESPRKPPIVDELQWKSSQVPIAASGGFQLPIKLDARKGELHYSFSTRDYDVNFGVQMICADGSLIELLDTRRYDSQRQQVQGQLSLSGPGMVLLLWDNSFSWVNSKQLAYHVELKQETLPVSEAEKTQLALRARLEREHKLLQCEGEFDGLETQVHTEAQTIDFLRHQIEELQTQLRQHEEAKESVNKKKDQVGEQIEELCWELQALSWRCLDQAALHRILDFLGEKDVIAWSLTCKKWNQYGRAYRASTLENAKPNAQAAA